MDESDDDDLSVGGAGRIRQAAPSAPEVFDLMDSDDDWSVGLPISHRLRSKSRRMISGSASASSHRPTKKSEAEDMRSIFRSRSADAVRSIQGMVTAPTESDDRSVMSRFSANESESDDDKARSNEKSKKSSQKKAPAKAMKITEKIKKANAAKKRKHKTAPTPKKKCGVNKSTYGIISSFIDVSIYETPLVVRPSKDFYHMKIIFGERVLISEDSLVANMQESPIERVKDFNGGEYELFYSKFVSRKGKMYQYDDNKGQKYYRSYYLRAFGGSSVAEELLRIADFENLAYEKGPESAAAYLQLLVSPAAKAPGGKKQILIHRLDSTMFIVIEDNGHGGCGFISRALLYRLLGSSIGKKVIDAMAVQIRAISPTKFGIAKGMLMIDDDLDDNTIVLSTSMIKVEKSKSGNPLHNDVILVISGLFLSDKAIVMDKIMDSSKQPTKSDLKKLEPPSQMFLNVLMSRGVPPIMIEEYLSSTQDTPYAVKHFTGVGVADPKGAIPPDCVFVTGMHLLGREIPKRVLITRSPCTEAKDAMVLKVVCNETDLIGADTDNAFKFFISLPFGSIVFPLGNPSLTSRINSSDLDGDRFFYIWDEQIVNAADSHDNGVEDDFVYLRDDFVGTTVRCSGESGKSDVGEILGKTEGGDKYLIAVDSKPPRMEVWSEEELYDGRDYMKRVIGHKVKGSETWFDVEWESGLKQTLLCSDIKKDNGTPPFVLLEYVERNELLTNKDCRWLKQHLDDRRYSKTLCRIVNHRGVGLNTEVECEYDDGVVEWEPLSEHLVESKIIVAKYAKDQCLLDTKEWCVARNFWFEEIQDCIMGNRYYEVDLLIKKLCGKWKQCCEKYGPNSADSKIWGRAYKKANELIKHVDPVKLPLSLYRELVGKNEKTCKFLSLIEPLDAYVWPPLASEVNRCGDNANTKGKRVDEGGVQMESHESEVNDSSGSELFSSDDEGGNSDGDDGWGRRTGDDDSDADNGWGRRTGDDDSDADNGWGRKTGDDDSDGDDGWGRRTGYDISDEG